MESVSKWLLTDEEKDKFIEALTPNLPALRIQAEISQEELANLIGISRQTYSAIERKVRRMSWSTYLSLVFFFDHNQKTHEMLHMLSLFPKEFIFQSNDGMDYSSLELSAFLGDESKEIIDQLDEKAKRTIYSIIMVEYARCSQLESEAVVKAFSGMNQLSNSITDKDVKVNKALKSIKKSRK